MVWALFYWNLRKTVFRLRGRRGIPPCQHPSDSGVAMKTACDACAGWNQRERFRHVCPLLRRNEAGAWVCGVAAAEVRPFWGRAFGWAGGSVLAIAVVAAVGVYSGMRGIGYEVSWRQILWPPAWSELHAVRADLFIRQAREKYAAGQVREAIQALTVAYQLNPAHYEVAMMLAQFHQAGSPQQSDRLYEQLMRLHPDRRSEIARAWFQSLLARGQMEAIANLAKIQLVEEPKEAAVWTHALLFAARHLPEANDLEEVVNQTAAPVAARAVLNLAVRLRHLPPEQARKVLIETPAVMGFPFDRVYRVETLIRLGFPRDALGLLAAARQELAGRDIARLIFAAYAKMGNRERLRSEFAALLAPGRDVRPAEFTLLGVHLVEYPDADLAALLIQALPRLEKTPADVWLESVIVAFCAAGAAKDEAAMASVKQQLRDTYAVSVAALDGLELFFLNKAGTRPIEAVLPGLSPLSLELNYALLDRFH